MTNPFDAQKFNEAIIKAHFYICVTQSTDPEKQKILEQMKENSTKNMELMSKLLGDKEE